MPRILRLFVVFGVLPVMLLAAGSLAWLYVDAHRSLDARFAERHGTLAEETVTDTTTVDDQYSEFVTLRSDSGLQVSLRTIRPAGAEAGLPVMIVLGGHRTGSEAVALFGNVGARAVVALDYPYHGPARVRGLKQVLAAIPPARQAVIDTPPAVALAIDWTLRQSWADPARLVIVGASLGVPFATLAAARDPRIGTAMLVHGAADNRAWLETQLARRDLPRPWRAPLATLLYWLAYGPTFDAGRNIGLITPRPVIVIGARQDERTPGGQTEALFAAAGEPRVLRWTEGRHVQPNRTEIIAELLRLADELLPFQEIDDR